MKHKKVDKRTKLYRDSLKALNKSKGLGDDIEKIMQATGVKTLIETIWGEGCGCDKRKEKLNKMFRYKVECLVKEEYNYLKELFGRLKSRILRDDQIKLLVIYNRIFNKKKKVGNCGSCWVSIINDLKRVYNEHSNELE